LKIRTNPKEAKEQSPKEESSLIIFLSFPFSGFFFGFMLMHFLSLSFCFFSYFHQHEFLLFLFLLSGGSKPNKSKKRIITARQEKEEEEERILPAAPDKKIRKEMFGAAGILSDEGFSIRSCHTSSFSSLSHKD